MKFPPPTVNTEPRGAGPAFDQRRVVEVERPPARRGLLAGMRIRKKLIFLHTLFSLTLGGILLLALRPAVNAVVSRAEVHQARALLEYLLEVERTTPELPISPAAERLLESAAIRTGTAKEIGLGDDLVLEAKAADGRVVEGFAEDAGRVGVAHVPLPGGEDDRYTALTLRIPEARAAVARVYLLVVLSLLAMYALVAAALEVFVLPQAVYEPVRRMLAADRAVQDGRTREEIIEESAIPADELGQIMTSRNDSVIKLRRQEAALNDALARLEMVANDLKRKNHLLEAARRNLADADRLASLGMMSAGIAHELNTPLAVLKGLVEKINRDPARGVEPTQAALMLRVVSRLEGLGESLLDFARVRPPRTREAVLRSIVQEALTLVRLDRESGGVELRNAVSEGVTGSCDPDRMVQVFVNLVRNAVQAASRAGDGRGGVVEITAEVTLREGRPWVSVRVADNGSGIDAAILPRLFEPFASTRLDSHGTGLGLAVAEGIVREHGGVLLARNRTDGPGAVFEVMLPVAQPVRVAAAIAGELA